MRLPRTRRTREPERHASHELLRKARKLLRVSVVSGYRRGLKRGVAAAIEHESIPLPRIRTVIDVGAHSGQFALLARERFPEAHLYCFEPLERPRRRLAAVFKADDRVTVLPVAASRSRGESRMHVSKLDDSSSLLPIGGRYVAAFPGTEEASTASVATVTLDEALTPLILQRPTLLKIDVQGAEFEVIAGGPRTLSIVDHILVEVSFLELYEGQALASELVAELLAKGFTLTGCFNVKRSWNGQCIQADFLFARGSA